MKSDVLERLLMDSVLGRLEPDVEALLADYLANDPAAAAQAQKLQEMVHLAAKAVRRPAPEIKLPSPIHRLVWWHRAEQALALAASFAVGVGITALVIRTNFRRDNGVVARAPPNPPVLRLLTPASACFRQALVQSRVESLPFWSNQRVYLLASAVGQLPSKTSTNLKEMLK